MSTGALILAAGAGTRFGEEPKLLAELDGRPVLAHVVEAARSAASVERVVVVVGARGEAVRAAVAGAAFSAPLARRGGAPSGEPPAAEGAGSGGAPVAVVDCPAWAGGQSASLRCGLAALRDVERVLVLVGDQPGVTAAAIDRIAAQPPGSRAAYGGRPGHPALLGAELVAVAERLEGDRGLRDVTEWRLVECGDVASGRDVDTPEDLEALRANGGAGGR